MMTSAMLRSVARSMSRLSISSSATRPSLTILSSSSVTTTNAGISCRSFISGSTIEADTKESSTTIPKKSTRTKSSTTTTKKPKKVAAPKKPKKAPAKKKLKSWEKLGPDGKLLPLPSASKPKKRSAFLIYYAKRLPDLKDDTSMQKSTGKFDVVKATKKVGQEWTTMNEEEKQPFYQEAQKVSEQYSRDLERWRNSLTTEDIKRENAYITSQRRKGKKGIKTIKIVDPSKPKKPLSAFIRFSQEYRQKNASEVEGLSIVEKAKKAGAAWQNLAASEKEPFERRFAEEKQKYDQEMQAFNQSQSS